MKIVSAPAGLRALGLHVHGVVQGVGFRPFVYRIASRHKLNGWVRNAAGEVQIEVEGATPDLDAFMTALRHEAPPLARVERIDVDLHQVSGATQFRILQSADDHGGQLPVAPDVGLCDACLAELFTLGNRRYRYPFITCSDCGPRFSVIEQMPYDRERTTMRAFMQCPTCAAEYASPGDRRFHSETNSCPQCGPELWLESRDGPRADGETALRQAADRLISGEIVAIRGVGGFHLAVDATNDTAVARLRERKRRDAKPLAVMVLSLDDAHQLGVIGPEASALLSSPERPIVICERRKFAPLAESVAPGLGTIGLMLAYTPVQYLLLDLVQRPLVMTSGNRSAEPIAAANAEAREQLQGVADAFLFHDRHIVARSDDSVLRVAGGHRVMLRRARGFAPLPIDLPHASPVPLIAVGGQLKSTFALVQGSRAWISPHLGDLDDADTADHYVAMTERFSAMFRIEPTVIAHDLHPDYAASALAEFPARRTIGVQHHHAHIAAVMAEHGRTERTVGVAFDGAGYGADGATWGAEFLVADLRDYRRAGHLRYMPLPGADLAARRPWRSALAVFALDPGADTSGYGAYRHVDPRELELAREQIRHNLNAPRVSSMGRLFDAAAAVLGVREVGAYEGQAAMELESLAARILPTVVLPLPFAQRDGMWVLDPVPLLTAIGEAERHGTSAAELAAALHDAIARSTVEIAARIARDEGIDTVTLGGGVFQNARLLVSVRDRLVANGLHVLEASLLPPNDGGLCFGQAAVAIARL